VFGSHALRQSELTDLSFSFGKRIAAIVAVIEKAGLPLLLEYPPPAHSL
jgi:hypothetical protein